MGVKTRIVLYAPDEATAKRACRAAFDRIGDLEDIMSDYRPTSELMRLCDRAGGAPVKVSKELFFVLERAVKLSERTEGAFDVTVGPFVKLWRQARKTGQLPSEEKLRRARALVGWRKIRLDPKARTVQLLVPGMKLDLGGIAKGYAGDCAIAVLKQHRIKHALIELGGDIVVSKAPPSSQGWRIELAGEPPGSKMRLLTLADAAVSTSGDTAQFVEIGGRRYSHIIDPRTGLGLTNRIAATVIARDGITSDPLATAACVLGEEKMRDLTKFYPGVKFYIRTAGE